ncbi:Type II secretion system protein F [Pirellulimonas nuda]|uniref:Type II secretion system protein F n=1 Tax=Pirellulimonas nuda TaxID=2528009 RepID=A0A518D7J4_9BACT|nr:type II secretion system F family protein [Pirellulimonas nuda]QDU87426.1 Type II secretion system protein F [Pirellulimonas nuda]
MIFGSPTLGSKRLAELCHRLAISAESGIDIRRTWEREAQSASGRVAERFAVVRDGVARGETLSEAMHDAGAVFPRLMLDMVDVGEKTGTLSEVMRRLSQHYDHRWKMARMFRAELAWPLLQLAAAVGIIGLLILILGMIPPGADGRPIDVLGWGLIGVPGLIIYTLWLIAIAVSIGIVVSAIRSGRLWTRPLQHWVMRVPVVGPAIEKICLAQIAWALHLTLNVEMDLRRLVPLALRASGSDYYKSHAPQMVADVEAGRPLNHAFAHAGVFPAPFLDSLAVAEESGQIVESMARLSRQYQEEAEGAIHTLTVVSGFLVWGAVATLIVVMIFRLASFYLGILNDAIKM